MTENHYDTLGLGHNTKCTQSDINDAYKKLAKEWHPDKNKDCKMVAEEKFKKISKAYQILSDPDLRKNYDLHGIDTTQNVQNIIDPHQMFKDIFDNEDNNIPPAIIHLDADINDLYQGFTKNVSYGRYSPCKKCDSTGTKTKRMVIVRAVRVVVY